MLSVLLFFYIGSSGAAKILLDAHTTAIAGHGQENSVTQARLHSDVIDDMNHYDDIEKKMLVVALALQTQLVHVDGLMVSGEVCCIILFQRKAAVD